MKVIDRVKFRPRALHFIPYTLSFFCLLLLSPASVRADEFTRTSRYAARLFSYGLLIVDTRMGDVRIEGWDEPRVEVEAEKTVRAGSERKAQPLFDLIRIELAGQDKEVRLRTIYPKRSWRRPFRDESKLSVNLRVKMPYGANLTLRCVDADVRVTGLVSREQLRVNYGDVEIDVPVVYRLRCLVAHTWLGFVHCDMLCLV